MTTTPTPPDLEAARALRERLLPVIFDVTAYPAGKEALTAGKKGEWGAFPLGLVKLPPWLRDGIETPEDIASQRPAAQFALARMRLGLEIADEYNIAHYACHRGGSPPKEARGSAYERYRARLKAAILEDEGWARARPEFLQRLSTEKLATGDPARARQVTQPKFRELTESADILLRAAAYEDARRRLSPGRGWARLTDADIARIITDVFTHLYAGTCRTYWATPADDPEHAVPLCDDIPEKVLLAHLEVEAETIAHEGTGLHLPRNWWVVKIDRDARPGFFQHAGHGGTHQERALRFGAEEIGHDLPASAVRQIKNIQEERGLYVFTLGSRHRVTDTAPVSRATADPRREAAVPPQIASPGETFTYIAADVAAFRKNKDKWGGFSNMASDFPLVVGGVTIGSSEALFQAMKFPHAPDVQRRILAERSSFQVAKIGRSRQYTPRPDWREVRVAVMRWALRVKLAQHWERFGALLQASGALDIVEDSSRDDFWGAKPIGGGLLAGENRLGRLLMELRDELRREPDALKVVPPAIPDFLLLGHPIETVRPAPPDDGEARPRVGEARPSRARATAPTPAAAIRVRPPLRALGDGTLTAAHVPVPQRVYCGAAVRLMTLSRFQAARLVMGEPYMIISIDSPGKDVPALAESPLCVGVLRVLFNDISRPRKGKLLFERSHARAILDFVSGHLPRARAILVHCTHGIFRSPAVAAALSTILQGEEWFFQAFHTRNPHVYNTLLAEWRSDPRPAQLCDATATYEPQEEDQVVTVADASITLFRRPYSFLSNFSRSPVVYEGVTYPTVEHAYQAAKTLVPAMREKIRLKENPRWARETGKSKSFPVRDGWDGIKLTVMPGLLRQKFSDPKRAALLLATGKRELIEGNWWGDQFWGMCQGDEGEWRGENHLGRLLMQVRDELAERDDLHPQ